MAINQKPERCVALASNILRQHGRYARPIRVNGVASVAVWFKEHREDVDFSKADFVITFSPNASGWIVQGTDHVITTINSGVTLAHGIAHYMLCVSDSRY